MECWLTLTETKRDCVSGSITPWNKPKHTRDSVSGSVKCRKDFISNSIMQWRNATCEIDATLLCDSFLCIYLCEKTYKIILWRMIWWMHINHQHTESRWWILQCLQWNILETSIGVEFQHGYIWDLMLFEVFKDKETTGLFSAWPDWVGVTVRTNQGIHLYVSAVEGAETWHLHEHITVVTMSCIYLNMAET